MSIRTCSVRLLTAATLVAAGACASTPKYQGLTPDQLFEVGRTEFEEGDWDEAAEALDRLLLTTPQFSRADEARMLLARSYFEDEQYLTASQEFIRFLDSHRGHPRSPEAALWVCRSYDRLSPITARDQSYTEQAVGICRNVVQDYPGSEEGAQAADIANRLRAKLAEKVFLAAEQYERRGARDSAVIYFEIVVERYGDTAWAPRAIVHLMAINEVFGYDDEVEEWRQRLLNSYPDSPEAQRFVNGGDGGPDTGDDGDARGGR